MSVRLERLDPAGADHDALVALLVGETFPFHVRPRLDAAEAEHRVARGDFGDDRHESWWVLAPDGRRAGLVTLADLQDTSPLLDLRLTAAFRGRGIGTAALRALAQHAFTRDGAPARLEGWTRQDNRAMRRAFERCGWVQEACHREAWPVEGGVPLASIGYGLLRRDWMQGFSTPLPWSAGERADAPAEARRTTTSSPVLAWRGAFEDAEVDRLHAEGFDHAPFEDAWRNQVERWSLGWVTAREGDRLVGFVNVAWDGLVHAFVLDTLTAADRRRAGIGAALVAVAADGARDAGCEWLHVDFEPHLRSFYFDACGFRPTDAGLIALR